MAVMNKIVSEHPLFVRMKRGQKCDLTCYSGNHCIFKKRSMSRIVTELIQSKCIQSKNQPERDQEIQLICIPDEKQQSSKNENISEKEIKTF